MLTAGVVGFIMLCVYHWAVFIKIPSTIAQTSDNGNHDSAIRQLKFVLLMPSFVGQGMKLMTRFLLGDRLVLVRRYEEAAQTLQDLLKTGIPRTFELHVRKRLADSFDGLGLIQEAEAERDKVGAIAGSMPSDPAASIAQAEVLHSGQLYDQEVAVLERALSSIPIHQENLRIEFLSRLAISWTIAGNAEKAAGYAEKSLELAPSRQLQLTMHQMASLSYCSLGQLDKAAEHTGAAINLAVKLNDLQSETISRSLKVGELRSRGELRRALELAEEIAEAPGGGDYMTRLQHFATLKQMGRFDDAVAVLEREICLEPGDAPVTPDIERVTECAILIAKSEIYGEQGKTREAWDAAQRGAMGFKDNKMLLHCDSLFAWLRALLNQPGEASRLIERVETRMESADIDNGSKIDILLRIANASILIGDHPRARGLIQELIHLNPSPIYMPQVYYQLGECDRGEGQTEEAKIAYQKSMEFHIDSYHARLSGQRLSELSAQHV